MWFRKKQPVRCPSVTDEVIKVVRGMEQMKNPPKTVTLVFFADGTVEVAEKNSIYLNKCEFYTYELKPKGGPENAR